MIKQHYVIFFILLGISVFGLFQIKFKVQSLNIELVELKQQLEREKSSIHVLKAEWAYLNQPERLNRLVKKFLDLKELKPEQILLASNEEITKFKKPTDKNAKLINTSYSNKKTTKWRYRNRPDSRPKK
jgi:cell division protein FtsL